MRYDVLNKLFRTKFVVLAMPEEEKIVSVDELRCYLRQYLLEFDAEDVGRIIDQIDSLTIDDRELLFSESFFLYNILKFDDICSNQRMQFNDALRIALMLFDYEENLEKAVV